jgi:hypothetical protein
MSPVPLLFFADDGQGRRLNAFQRSRSGVRAAVAPARSGTHVNRLDSSENNPSSSLRRNDVHAPAEQYYQVAAT